MKRILLTLLLAAMGGVALGQLGGGSATKTIHDMPVRSLAPFTCNSANEGYIYFNTTDDKHYACDGSSWQEVLLIDGSIPVPRSSNPPATCNNAAKGLVYYDNDDNKLRYCDGTIWRLAGLPEGTTTPDATVAQVITGYEFIDFNGNRQVGTGGLYFVPAGTSAPDATPCDVIRGKEFVNLTGTLQTGTLRSATFTPAEYRASNQQDEMGCKDGTRLYQKAYSRSTSVRTFLNDARNNIGLNNTANCAHSTNRRVFELFSNAIFASGGSDRTSYSISVTTDTIVPVCN